VSDSAPSSSKPTPSTFRLIDAVIFDFGGVLASNGRPSDVAKRFPNDPVDKVMKVMMGDYGQDTDHPWHRLERGEISMVEATPKTGRLHQIRAHFEHIGHAVVHDKIYGQPDRVFLNYIDKDIVIEQEMARHSLHSSKISFFWLNSPIFCEIPIPADLFAIWEGSDPVSVAVSASSGVAR
jgi:23S rRNA-/tRNA-specific pseudouridylate synthase